MSIYTKTATKSKSGKIYAFGREKELDGQPKEKGGYAVYVVCENYAGHVRDGIRKSWRYVQLNMTYAEAVALMNKKCGYKAFNS